MALEIRQVQKLAQQLVMTPQLQQAIKLLQLSRVELQEMISKELQDNPTLEEGTAEETENGDQSKSELPPDGAEPITEPVINREPARIPRHPFELHPRISDRRSHRGRW
jgi:RNA polymerase sigma-54 factor